jgi:hypothetical protein
MAISAGKILKERDLKKNNLERGQIFFPIQSWLLKWFNQPYNII